MAELIGGPINDLFPQDVADTSGPSQAQTTFGEGVAAAASNAWHDLPMQTMSRSNLRSLGQTAFDPDAPIQPGTGFEFDQGAATAPDDANKQAKQAGATLTPFIHPVGQDTLKDLITDNIAQQRRADVISRTADGITGGAARFGVGALVSLTDPLNDMAMMIPGAPDAWAAEKIAQLGGGVLARAAVRGASGALQGAAGMAALVPFQYAAASQDHEDYGWGDALRQVGFGALLGAGGGALHGMLEGRPDTTDAVLRASMARVLSDDPRGVDVGAILDHGEAEASTAPPPANSGPVNPELGPKSALSEFPGSEANVWRDGDTVIRTLRNDYFPPNGDPVRPLSNRVLQPIEANPATRTERLPFVDNIQPLDKFPAAEVVALQAALRRDGLVITDDRGANFAMHDGKLIVVDPGAVKPIDRGPSARAMATRAMNATDPELERADRVTETTLATAPKLEGEPSKDLAEVNAMLADVKGRYMEGVSSGTIAEHPSLADAGKEELDHGNAQSAYAACLGAR